MQTVEPEGGSDFTILLEGLKYPEAPFWSPLDNRLYFAEWTADRISYYNGGQAHVFIENQKGDGPSGIVRDKEGNFWVCLYSSRRLVKLSPSGKILRSIDAYRGEAFRGPNDLVLGRKGGIYFTDSGDFEDDWKTGRPAGALYYLTPSGSLMRVDDDLCYPNGLALSPGGRILYVSEHRKNRILEYSIESDGGLSDRETFFRLDDKCAGPKDKCFELGPDGMCRDSAGNLYVAHYRGGKIVVVTPEGRMLGKIRLPKGANPTNAALGPDEKTLYVTEAELGMLLSLDMEKALK